MGKVGEVLEMSNSELLKIRNFGEKSLKELMTKFRSEGMLSEEEWEARMKGHGSPGKVDDELESDRESDDESGLGNGAEELSAYLHGGETEEDDSPIFPTEEDGSPFEVEDKEE
jgi:hypothetical protein